VTNALFEKGINAFLNGDVSWLRDGIRAVLVDLDNWAVPIADASGDTPIIVTATRPHGFNEGDMVNIVGVTGNATANGMHAIHVIDDSHFQLLDSIPGGAYIGGGFSLNLSIPEFLADIPSDARVAISHLFTGKEIVKGALMADTVDFGIVDSDSVLEAAVIFQDTGLLSTSRLLCYFDHGVNLPLTPNGTITRLIWDSSGIVSLWV
jgi:hypothetical protein